jgi:DNA (cytosine-5)-methyltransferase 1
MTPRYKAVDLFAGGGGASLGIEWALGVPPVLAVNHCPAAIHMHAANHPQTIHLTEDVFDVSPWTVHTGGKGLDLLWASPSCTHFSRARGGKPVREQLRTLGWVVVEWARAIAPRVIITENVAEMLTWGPLNGDGTPIKARAGETFREWVKALQLAGYRVEWRILNAADFGAPTRRKRLFIVARRDREPIRWPTPTHGNGLAPCGIVADCIDWSIPCPSIFTRKKPLAAATLRRVVEGIRRYVLNGRPFLVNLTHGARVENVDEPARTITGAHRGEKAVVGPHLLNLSHGGRSEPVDEPARTLTATPKGGDRMVVAPMFTRAHGHGWDCGGGPSTPPDGLLPTLTATDEHALGAGHLVKLYGKSTVADIAEPMPTITGTDKLGLACAFLDKMRGSARAGQRIDQLAPTATAGGEHQALIAASIVRHNGTTPGHGNAGRAMNEPLGAVTSVDTHGLMSAYLVSTANGEREGQRPRARPVTEPLTTVTVTGSPGAIVGVGLARYHGERRDGENPRVDALDAAMPVQTTENRFGLIAGSLVAYYGSETDGQGLNEPLRTVPTKDRFAHVDCDLRQQLTDAQLDTALAVGQLLTAHGVAVGADGLVSLIVDGELYVLVDIGLRMLTPRELARAQGFPDTYLLTGTRSEQIARIGNSVCPPVVEALVRAQLRPETVRWVVDDPRGGVRRPPVRTRQTSAQA